MLIPDQHERRQARGQWCGFAKKVAPARSAKADFNLLFYARPERSARPLAGGIARVLSSGELV